MECEAAGVEVSFFNHDPPFWACFPPDITQPHKSLYKRKQTGMGLMTIWISLMGSLSMGLGKNVFSIMAAARHRKLTERSLLVLSLIFGNCLVV